jgi:hypothetical protein
VSDLYEGALLQPSAQNLAALNRRLGYLRSAVLFAGVAAEAYANEFLAGAAPTYAGPLDRLPTPDKLLIGSRLAGVEPPLELGRLPLQRLVRLAEVRNALVHPRRDGKNSVSAFVHNVMDRDLQLVGPRVTSELIVAVAEVIVRLEPYCAGVSPHGHATLIAANPSVLETHWKILGDKLTALPERDADEKEPLFVLLQRRHTKKAQEAARDDTK